MQRFTWLPVLAAVAVVGIGRESRAAPRADTTETRKWTDEFHLSDCAWSSTGRNDYFILVPGYQETLDGGEGKDSTHLEITVLGETRTVAGVETRIVEERETQGGRLVEISRNLYAVCGPANDVFYFGEEVDMYKDSKVTSHEGAWTAGAAGARAGLFMPARPLLGSRFYQEVAPGAAMDRVEIVSDSEALKTPEGTLRACLKTEETTPLEPRVKEYKLYARGIGIVEDEGLVLTKHGFIPAKNP